MGVEDLVPGILPIVILGEHQCVRLSEITMQFDQR